MRYIGDVHGKFSQYRELIRGIPASIQVGDLGLGFRRVQGPNAGEIYNNPPHYAMVQGNHRFIRGNHDNPGECRKHSQWIKDGEVEGSTMFLGGGESVDRQWRQEGYNWWPEEQLGQAELWEMIDLYINTKPSIMVTHECPTEIANILAQVRFKPPSRTSQALQAMWSTHSPALWVFGHWHIAFDQVANGTRFVCLPELAHLDI